MSNVYFGDSKPKDGEGAGDKAGAKDDDAFGLPGNLGSGGDFADLDEEDLPF